MQKPEKKWYRSYFGPIFLSDCLTPCFLESVFCQELEKTGFRFVRDRESDEIHLFLYRTHLIFNNVFCSKHKVLRRVWHGKLCISSLSLSRTNLKPVFSSSWQKTDSKKQGVRQSDKNYNKFKKYGRSCDRFQKSRPESQYRRKPGSTLLNPVSCGCSLNSNSYEKREEFMSNRAGHSLSPSMWWPVGNKLVPHGNVV